ncbi:14362_t:CDS:2 [Gigaspora rosea]|nr:14362_t:CDS:2 [Gigaspora rosea]
MGFLYSSLQNKLKLHAEILVNSVSITSSSVNPVPIASTFEKTNTNNNKDEDSFLEAN